MNARLVLVCALLAAAGCATPTAAQREDAINAALTSAYVACKVALADKEMTWEPGAEAYCRRVVDPSAGCESP